MKKYNLTPEQEGLLKEVERMLYGPRKQRHPALIKGLLESLEQDRAEYDSRCFPTTYCEDNVKKRNEAFKRLKKNYSTLVFILNWVCY